MHGIAFTAEQLTTAMIKDDPDPILHTSTELASQMFAPYLLEFECDLTEPLLAKQLVRVV